VSRKQLARITRCTVGFGGYQDAMIGVAFTFEGERWGIADFWGAWATERHEGTEWTEEERIQTLGEALMRLRGVLKQAKRNDAADLVGTPVEVEINDHNVLADWRVLTEVI
jgi:hypothetical protein